MTRLAVAATLGFAVALAVVSFAAAQGGPDVQIDELECIDVPDVVGIQELVRIKNLGDVAQDLSGWELRSDPEVSEVFDLRDLGTDLAPGVSDTIQSGPAASGAFTWSTDEVFRDNDPTDYVRLVDDAGATVDQVNCAAEATPIPTATPEASPPEGVPNGGGPPSPAAGALSSTMMLLLGGSMAAAGLGAIALPRLHLRTSPAAPAPPRRRSAAHRGRGSLGEKPGYSALYLAAVVLTAVIAFRFLRRH